MGPGGAWHLSRRRPAAIADRKSTRLNSSHLVISYAVFCLKKNNTATAITTSKLTTRAPSPRVTSCSACARPHLRRVPVLRCFPALPRFLFFFFLRIGRPPRSPLFPYAPLFRSHEGDHHLGYQAGFQRIAAGGILGESVGSEEHTSELQSPCNLVCRLLLEKN